jgi:hypothetical protein
MALPLSNGRETIEMLLIVFYNKRKNIFPIEFQHFLDALILGPPTRV